ncbi:hypothetical protein JR316_0006237 [Psilocybe cubensis]|uniref:Uncharacterized protein n=2 Tax=Psilocybe cubensis TaxID=181762 RepID=A0ACB8H1W3_PSICU|nr:hypothetical protein JR316_0006237 [Psilocybe cubensis]KAH9481710.1 hypothetical protein JR316_0006237 [Psilocybe cubensis]
MASTTQNVSVSQNSHTSPTNTASNASGNANSTSAPGGDTTYPEQLHAGKVGYGPNFRTSPSLGDKIQGLKEELKGKVTRNPDLVQHGKDVKSGEERRKDLLGEDEHNPFDNVKEDDEGKGKDVSQGPTTHKPSGAQSSQNPSGIKDDKNPTVAGSQSPQAYSDTNQPNKTSSQTDPFGMAPSQVSGERFANQTSTNTNMTGIVNSAGHQPQPLDQTPAHEPSNSGARMSGIVDSARHNPPSHAQSNHGFNQPILQQSTNMSAIVDSARHEPRPLSQAPEHHPTPTGSESGFGGSAPQRQNKGVNAAVHIPRHRSNPMQQEPVPASSSNFGSDYSVPQQAPKANPFGMAVNQGHGKGAMEQAATVAPEGTEDAEKQRKGNNVEFAARPVEARQ